jgi:hypothetical protein
MKKIQNLNHQVTSNLGICQQLLGGVIAILLTWTMTACDSGKPRASTLDVGGSKAERVAEVSKIIGRSAPLPSPILDAHFVEEQTGDGTLGPSDFASFSAITVAPDDLAVWRSALQPIERQNTPAKLVNPKQAQPWWVTPNDFGALEFYSPKSLTGRNNGWVGIAPDGRIFVYSFTM